MPDSVRRLPAEPGVYRFRDATGRVLYIGRATELRSRVASYWGGLPDRRHLRRMVSRVARVEAAVCASVHEAAWLERNLLEDSLPRWNRTAGGQETPVYLSVDERRAAPGVRMLYEPADGCFGPYLGGQRVRAAATALHRIHPLPYTSTRLTGSERDLAGKRGVTPEHREALAEALRAVLRREPAAVAHTIAELTRSRDRAAEALSFELAGQIQAELMALDWVTCVQRATTRDTPDAVIQGWAGGVLVAFTVQNGRLGRWRQRAAADGPRKNAPGLWLEFAQRNAELAAHLQSARI